jgi:hypothetical protein
MACLHNMVGRLMIDATGCGVLLSPSSGALTSATQDLAAQRAVGLPEEWRRVAELGAWAGVGVEVSWRGCCHGRAEWNAPASLPEGCRESRTSTCTGWWHGSATTGALQL